GAATDGALAWCHPVISAAEARAVVTDASQLRAQARSTSDWQEHGLSRKLRQRADLLEARLVDPLWRAFAARALQVAA
ncbi:MAG: DNA repair protein RadC, partial [bacterium]